MKKKKERDHDQSCGLHPPFQTGVIDIGAHMVRMDVYELNRSWVPEKLESMSRPFNLGADVFRNGYVSVESIVKLVDVVDKYRKKIVEYGTPYYRIIATSAVREAFNKELIADRFREAGMNLEIVEGAAEATLSYLAVRDTLPEKMESSLDNAVMLIMGSGSLFVIGIVGKLMRFCEEMPTGTLRMNDTLGSSEPPLDQLRQLLKSQRILRRLSEGMQLDSKTPVSLVLVGNSARKLAALANDAPEREKDWAQLDAKEFSGILEDCEEGSKKLFKKVDPDEVMELSGAAVIVRHFFNNLNCKEILCPGMTTRGAVLRDWVRQLRFPEVDPFRADLAAVCGAIGRKYDFDASHAVSVAAVCSMIFNKLRSFHSFPEHTGLLLEAASYLHDIGRFIDARRHQRHSWYLITNTKLPGLTASEQRIVAAAVRYHGKTLPRESHPEYASLDANEKVAVLKLAAILRVADALDLRSDDKMPEMKLVLRGRVLNIIADLPELNSRRYDLKLKGGLFEQVFGLEIKLLNGEL